MTVQNFNNESGRSMVEMLGTLAIIGVLSIGGISGYSYGMDKYRANQTINDIMLMSVDIITQTSRGVVPTLSEWGTKTTAGYDFSVKPNPTDATKSGIVVDGVPSRVCQMVGDALKTQATVYVSNVERGDTTDNDPCESSEENTMTFYFEGSSIDIEEKNEKQCGSIICKPCQRCVCDSYLVNTNLDLGTTGLNCGDNKICIPKNDYEACTQNGQFGWCISGSCELNTVCNCGQNQYCSDTNESFEDPTPSGQCKDLDFRTVDIDGTTYYISNDSMSWWDAQSACAALGDKTLLSGYDLLQNWDGQYSLNDHECSDLLNKLRDYIDNSYIWTRNPNPLEPSHWAIILRVSSSYCQPDSLERNLWGSVVCR